MAPTRAQQDVRDEFIRVHGAWDDAWERILELASLVGMHAAAVAAPILAEELRAIGEDPTA
jgi:hypothetical protein